MSVRLPTGKKPPEQQRSGFFPRQVDTSYGYIPDLRVRGQMVELRSADVAGLSFYRPTRPKRVGASVLCEHWIHQPPQVNHSLAQLKIAQVHRAGYLSLHAGWNQLQSHRSSSLLECGADSTSIPTNCRTINNGYALLTRLMNRAIIRLINRIFISII